MPPPRIRVTDLASVIYSSGKVFDGLSTGRLDTENFLRSGDISGITSRADLALLQDLKDTAQFIIDHRDEPITAAFLQRVNATITRSGPMNPGRLRRQEQSIGVDTIHGRHEPDALDDHQLDEILVRAQGEHDPRERAMNVFLDVAKAQPFEDGNKRTALFSANSLLLRGQNPELLRVPVDDNDPDIARKFNEAVARYYVFADPDQAKAMMRQHSFTPL